MVEKVHRDPSKKVKKERDNMTEVSVVIPTNLFLKRKAYQTTFLPSVKTLPKETSFFSFSTGFLF
jgi:hypothetical protein